MVFIMLQVFSKKVKFDATYVFVSQVTTYEIASVKTVK